jgi:hypothetical protein
MKKYKIILSCIVLVGLVICHGDWLFASDRPAQFKSPEEVVAWLYRDFGCESFFDHYFDNDILIDQPRRVLERYFVPELAMLIQHDRLYAKRAKELGHIDFVFLFGSQDPDGIGNLRIKKITETNSVSVKYDQNGQHDIVEMQFDTVHTKRGWRISDIHYKWRQTEISSESNFSLRKLLSEPYE